ncbi:5'-nucleotidase C-terminal domain-containing protein [Psychrobacillus sp. FSL H8-0487]|uniref:5'-nucleotidase C-terminal domain-containing protein n=1 Tax=Psychrobacillus sp. FSL H8-0487 TaxID=2921391 RepID=UPI0030FBC520
MYRKTYKSITAALTIAAGLGLALAPQTSLAAEGDFNLTIMHTNDTHANVDAVAKRATVVKQIRSEHKNNLLLDAGDVFSGTLYFNQYTGLADLEFMNLLKYDAMTFGNHEFDLGATSDGHLGLAEFVKKAGFPFVSANVDFSKDVLFEGLQNKEYSSSASNGEIYNGIIKEIDGEKVGIFGLTTAETVDISSPNDIAFADYIEAAKGAVAAFEKAGVNKIIALTHIGYDDAAKYDNDLLLAEKVPGIDIIVGGHTHTKLDAPKELTVKGKPVLIVQANEYNKFLGQLDVSFNTEGVITDHTGILHDVAAVEIADPETVKLLKPYTDSIDKVKNTSTGKVALQGLNGGRGLWGVRAGETNLGNLITDGMLASAKKIDSETVIAMQNGGGIRASIDAGDITVGEVLTVMPFGNALAIASVTGEEIKSLLEHAISEFPKEKGAFLHVSGLKYAFDGTAEAGKRVLNIQVKEGDKYIELNNSKTYKVATNTFTAKGGDGFKAFETAYAEGRVSEPGNVDWEMFIEYITTLETVNPTEEGRINAVLPFKDINATDWHYSYIQDIFYSGLAKGTNSTTYSPNKQLTRAQATSLIVRALGLEAKGTATFTDVVNLHADTKAEIAAAAEAGIIKGVDGKFMPHKAITRAQFALMLNRAYDAKVEVDYVVKGKSTFSDLGKYDGEFVKAINMVEELNIGSGTDGKFRPTEGTTRAQAAKFVSNFTNLLK